jgi:hypothetical protein
MSALVVRLFVRLTTDSWASNRRHTPARVSVGCATSYQYTSSTSRALPAPPRTPPPVVVAVVAVVVVVVAVVAALVVVVVVVAAKELASSWETFTPHAAAALNTSSENAVGWSTGTSPLPLWGW